jgi:hypothetical protein
MANADEESVEEEWLNEKDEERARRQLMGFN